MFHDGHIHGGHAVQRGAFFLLHRLHGVHRGEGFQNDHGRAVVHAGHDPEHTAETVEERDGDTYTVIFAELLVAADPVAIVPDAGMGEHDPLGKARGA